MEQTDLRNGDFLSASLINEITAAVVDILTNKADKQSQNGGFAGGSHAACINGGAAIGQGAYSTNGAAVGSSAVTSDGVALGKFAKCKNGTTYIDAIQLGTGTNSTAKTLQVYNYQLMDANGKVPFARLDRPTFGNPYVIKTGSFYDGTTETPIWKYMFEATYSDLGVSAGGTISLNNIMIKCGNMAMYEDTKIIDAKIFASPTSSSVDNVIDISSSLNAGDVTLPSSTSMKKLYGWIEVVTEDFNYDISGVTDPTDPGEIGGGIGTLPGLGDLL